MEDAALNFSKGENSEEIFVARKKVCGKIKRPVLGDLECIEKLRIVSDLLLGNLIVVKYLILRLP